MGKASRRKKNRNVSPTVTDYQVLTENGRRCVEKHGMDTIIRANTEAFDVGMAYPRILLGDGNEYFAYDLESPDAATPLIALMNELRRKFGDYDRVPDWLAMLAIEEPWEHADRGHYVRFKDVLELHDAFPGIMITPATTWMKVLQKYQEFAAEQEREVLDNATRSVSPRLGSACRI